MYACSQYSVVLPRTAAQVLMCPDGTFRTHTSLRLNLNQAYLDFLIFVQRNKTSPGLMQFANRKPPEPPYTRKLMAPANQHLSKMSSAYKKQESHFWNSCFSRNHFKPLLFFLCNSCLFQKSKQPFFLIWLFFDCP